MFERNTVFCYVMVKGPASITISDPDSGIVLLTFHPDGTKSVYEEWTQMEDAYNYFYAERIGSVSVVAVPMDMNYRVAWTAEEKGTVECLNALCSVNASASYPGAVARACSG